MPVPAAAGGAPAAPAAGAGAVAQQQQPAAVPADQPFDMFGNAAGGGGGGQPDADNPLAGLRNQPQFQALRAMVQQRPEMLQPMLAVSAAMQCNAIALGCGLGLLNPSHCCGCVGPAGTFDTTSNYSFAQCLHILLACWLAWHFLQALVRANPALQETINANQQVRFISVHRLTTTSLFRRCLPASQAGCNLETCSVVLCWLPPFGPAAGRLHLHTDCSGTLQRYTLTHMDCTAATSAQAFMEMLNEPVGEGEGGMEELMEQLAGQMGDEGGTCVLPAESNAG